MKSFQACRVVVRSRRTRCAGGGTWYHRMAILLKVSKARGEVWVGGARLEHELTWTGFSENVITHMSLRCSVAEKRINVSSYLDKGTVRCAKIRVISRESVWLRTCG